MNLAFLVLAAILAWVLVARRHTGQEENQQKKRESLHVNRNQIRSGPNRQGKLSEEQLDQIKSIHLTFLEVYPVSLEETIANFQREKNVGQQIDLWLTMQISYLAIIKEKNYTDINIKKEVFQLILMSTMLSVDQLPSKVEIKILTKSDLEYVLNDFMGRLR